MTQNTTQYELDKCKEWTYETAPTKLFSNVFHPKLNFHWYLYCTSTFINQSHLYSNLISMWNKIFDCFRSAIITFESTLIYVINWNDFLKSHYIFFIWNADFLSKSKIFLLQIGLGSNVNRIVFHKTSFDFQILC